MTAFVRTITTSSLLLALPLGAALTATMPTTPAYAGNECLLDTTNDGVATDTGGDGPTTGPNDTVSGATAAGSATNLACGPGADASGGNSFNTAIGDSANASGDFSVNTATGASANASGRNSFNTATGLNANASGDNSLNVATGNSANASGNDGRNTAVGANSVATGTNSSAFGGFANATGAQSVAAGLSADAIGENAIAIGEDAQGGDAAADRGAIAIGNDGDGDGTGAQALSAGAIAIGEDTQATHVNSAAVGANARATHVNSAAFGQGAATTRANQQVFGTSTNTYTMRGIASAASRAAQSGPLEVVTSDANGNLATDGGEIFRRLDENTEGVALAMAMDAPDLQPEENFAMKLNWGHFESENGFAVTGTVRLGKQTSLDGGLGVGASGGSLGGRAGLRFGW